ncbi:TenA family transcriptional regulator [Dongia rigui]|uniref:Iron-containing redox enzyme family protein n=1 Tax=Dongia rigui TaxID=940149 RepID=A0ABU5DTM6_9PROT|nr:iron-containing redox enzyme family protein [Dongia rigui]MDY0870686.1 iron-containing redox enzyme family protein [Dongia rigui]
MFMDDLIAGTTAERNALLGVPLIHKALRGEVTRAAYIEFLTQAYHHVRHTVPLLMTSGARMPQRLAWLRDAIVEYIDEETGHDEWILADIDAAGGDASAVRTGTPSAATELMVAYAYDGITRRNPVVFFGMAHVLEGTSVQLASQAAGVLRQSLNLPQKAFTYLTSHGSLDIEHTKTFADLVNRLDVAEDRSDILHAARMFYRLYADIFRGVEVAA